MGKKVTSGVIDAASKISGDTETAKPEKVSWRERRKLKRDEKKKKEEPKKVEEKAPSPVGDEARPIISSPEKLGISPVGIVTLDNIWPDGRTIDLTTIGAQGYNKPESWNAFADDKSKLKNPLTFTINPYVNFLGSRAGISDTGDPLLFNATSLTRLRDLMCKTLDASKTYTLLAGEVVGKFKVDALKEFGFDFDVDVYKIGKEQRKKVGGKYLTEKLRAVCIMDRVLNSNGIREYISQELREEDFKAALEKFTQIAPLACGHSWIVLPYDARWTFTYRDRLEVVQGEIYTDEKNGEKKIRYLKDDKGIDVSNIRLPYIDDAIKSVLSKTTGSV